jgi:hypothetical protein
MHHSPIVSRDFAGLGFDADTQIMEAVRKDNRVLRFSGINGDTFYRATMAADLGAFLAKLSAPVTTEL